MLDEPAQHGADLKFEVGNPTFDAPPVRLALSDKHHAYQLRELA